MKCDHCGKKKNKKDIRKFYSKEGGLTVFFICKTCKRKVSQDIRLYKKTISEKFALEDELVEEIYDEIGGRVDVETLYFCGDPKKVQKLKELNEKLRLLSDRPSYFKYNNLRKAFCLHVPPGVPTNARFKKKIKGRTQTQTLKKITKEERRLLKHQERCEQKEKDKSWKNSFGGEGFSKDKIKE